MPAPHVLHLVGCAIYVLSLVVLTQTVHARGSAPDGRQLRARQTAAARHCLARARRYDPDVSGKVTLRVLVDRAGATTRVTTVSETRACEAVAQCLAERARRWPHEPAQRRPEWRSYSFVLSP
jgi:hypothetical protein